jgi:hypothetical protein
VLQRLNSAVKLIQRTTPEVPQRLQMIPISFCFIAITNAAHVGLPNEASKQVSGIINFVRNVGGSIFIAVTG